MLRTIKLGDKDVEMKATASTDIYYRNIFGIDPIREQSAQGFGPADLICMMERMAFVMSMQATRDRAAMGDLSPDSYLDWMDDFDRTDIMNAVPALRALYEGQKAPESVQKKTGGKRNANTI